MDKESKRNLRKSDYIFHKKLTASLLFLNIISLSIRCGFPKTVVSSVYAKVHFISRASSIM